MALLWPLLTSDRSFLRLSATIALPAFRPVTANDQTSPGNAHPPSRLCPPHIQEEIPCKYWTLKILAFSSMGSARFLFVRPALCLPNCSPARSLSFRFHLAMDTLAVQLTVPLTGSVRDFHPQVGAPCRAHQKKGPPRKDGPRHRFRAWPCGRFAIFPA